VSGSGVDWMLSVIVCYILFCHFIGGRFDQSNERWRTRGLDISSGRRRLRYHQSPSTDNSHQQELRIGTLSFSQNISNCKFICLCSFIFCTILMLNNHIYHFKWSSYSVSGSGVDWMLSVIVCYILFWENPWTGYIIWEKTSTLSSKPLNWQFTSASTSYLVENGHCILRR
jgi:hypothetical protein